jgi:CheY-like chemotaxis protein/HPt (histidine-containing phosphotransfer) domain-containing protein
MAFALRLSNFVTMFVDPTPAELPPGLLAEYRESAGAQLRVLAELADRLLAAGNDAEALDGLRRETHKIRGSAGSYGFWEASRLAAGMEETAKDWVARPDDADLDRGSIARWFVAQLAESLQLDPPAAGEPTPRPASAPARAAATAAPAPAPAAPADTPEVIVVEDDPALAGLLEYGLRARGYRFVTFRNGREALDALLALDVGDLHPLLLLDVDLPALDGYSILDALTRQRPGQYRIVFTTVHGDESEQLRGLEAGALDYLVKPISLRVALEKIRRWVGR